MLEVKAPGTLHFRLLGAATLTRDDAVNGRISSIKGFALLAYLAMNAGKPVSRSILADLLWSDRSESQARQSLRQAIFTLKRDLGPAYSALLQADDQSISIAADAVEVDALQFLKWASSSDDAARFRCLEMQFGPLLDGFSVDSEAFDNWVLAERPRLEAVAIRTFADLAARLDAAGDGDRAILAMERLVLIDPGEEERHRRLLTLEARYHGADAALARAKSLAEMLKRELDAEPEEATKALVEEIRRSARSGPYTGGSVAPGIVTTVTEDDKAPEQPPPYVGIPSPSKPRSIPRFAIATGLVLLAAGVVALAGAYGRIPQVFPAADKSAIVVPDLRKSIDPWLSPSLLSRPGANAPDANRRGPIAVAVLPFRHYNEEGSTAKLAAAMFADDLTNVLSRVPALRVISRYTSETFADRRIDAAAVGAELGVRYLVEGSVSVRGSLLRLNVELTDTRTRLHVWSTRVERDDTNIAAVHDEIVNGLARELRLEIGRIESAAISPTPDFHSLYFKGLAAISAAGRQGLPSLQVAEGYLNSALSLYPDSPLAQNGIAVIHTMMVQHHFVADREMHAAKAEAILTRLISRYPSLNEPHSTLGFLKTNQNNDIAAMHALERSIELNPSDAPSYSRLGRVLVRLGRPQEALDRIHYAMRLSPKDPALPYWFAHAGFAQVELKQYDKAIDSLNRTLAFHPAQPQTMMTLIAAHAMKGNMAEARRLLAELQAVHPHLTRDTLLKASQRLLARSVVTGEGMRRASETP